MLIQYHWATRYPANFRRLKMVTTQTNLGGGPCRVTDAHVHFWDLKTLSYPWLADVPAIRRSWGLSDYAAATSNIPIEHIVFVQCECLPETYQDEVNYVSKLAEIDTRIVGVVAYFPLEEPDAEARLEALVSNPLVRGIRRLEEEPVSLYRNHRFIQGMDALPRHGLTFDLGVKANQLDAALHLVERQPSIRYMLDHFGKPDISGAVFHEWKAKIVDLASQPTVHCKLSGLLTQADFENWTIDQLQPYVDTVMECFGAQRVSFGSDWPVVTMASPYQRWFSTAWHLCRNLAPSERDRVFYTNALNFYGITEGQHG